MNGERAVPPTKKNKNTRSKKPVVKKPVDALYAVIGIRLRNERIAQKRTLDQVATACGFSLQMLHYIENGTVVVSVAKLVRIARALARPTRFFIDTQRNLPHLDAIKSSVKGEWIIEGKGVLLTGKCTQAVADAIVEIGGAEDD
jgi:transcriptional regulator with XRE-family HTH domain